MENYEIARRVVLVEDNDDCRSMMSALLRAHGHSVVEADNGLEGLAAIERERPDVAFVDLGLPGLTGFEVARRVRSQGRLDRVRLITVTGYCSPADVAAAKAAGFDVHITKPASVAKLNAAMVAELRS